MTTFKPKKGKDGDWYWDASSKGRIKADGGEGYKRKSALLRSLKKFITDIQQGKFVIAE